MKAPVFKCTCRNVSVQVQVWKCQCVSVSVEVSVFKGFSGRTLRNAFGKKSGWGGPVRVRMALRRGGVGSRKRDPASGTRHGGLAKLAKRSRGGNLAFRGNPNVKTQALNPTLPPNARKESDGAPLPLHVLTHPPKVNPAKVGLAKGSLPAAASRSILIFLTFPPCALEREVEPIDDGWPESETGDCQALPSKLKTSCPRAMTKRYAEREKERADVKE